MAQAIQMPQPGNTVEECILVSWSRAKGEKVSAGEIIAEIETDKANFDIEAPADGVLLETFFDEGALVPVLTNICVIGEPGEEVEEFRPKVEEPAATANKPGTGNAVPSQTTLGTAKPVPVLAEGVLSPRARRFAEERRFFPDNVAGSGPGGRVLESDLRALYETTPRVSSTAREMIRSGFRARAEGSGVNRMVRAGDLTAPPERMPRMRETIARRMRESLATTAQYTLHASADATRLLALRRKLKAAGSDVNINDLIMYCTVKTLVAAPDVNAELIDGEIYRHSEIHLGFACDTPRGLVVPVVKDCQVLSLDDLAKRIHQLSEAAASGGLGPDEMTGGTFTVSNLGSLGIEAFTPIVNPPQVAILGVNAIQLKPVRRGDEVVFVDHIGFSLTCDHQLVDGAPGARFLQALKQNVEEMGEST